MTRIKTYTNYFDQIELFLLAVLFFFLPFNVKMAPILFSLLVLNFIVSCIFNKKKPNLSFHAFSMHYKGLSWVLIGMCAFEIIHFIGLSYSSNLDFGWFDVIAKLSFMLIPLFLYFNLIQIHKWVVLSFVLGCAFIVALNSIIYFFPDSFSINATHQVVFSKFMHRSYFGMYLLFGLSILYFYDKISPYFFYVLFPILSIGVVLSQSKAAILTLILINVIGFIFLIVSKNWKFIIYLISMAILLYLSPLKETTKTATDRFNNISTSKYSNDKLSTESNAARKFTWHASYEVIKEHTLFGVGTGDVKDQLNLKQQELGYLGIAKQKLNAHNQYLNTWMAIGLLGLIALCSFTIVGLLISLKMKNWLAFSFFSILSFNALFESIFETEAGIFAICFGVLLVFSKYNDNSTLKSIQ